MNAIALNYWSLLQKTTFWHFHFYPPEFWKKYIYLVRFFS